MPEFSLGSNRPSSLDVAPPDVFDLFYSERSNSIIGETGTGKTWLAVAALADELRHDEQAAVIFLDYETSFGAVDGRFKALGVKTTNLLYVQMDGPFEEAKAGLVTYTKWLWAERRAYVTMAVIDCVTPMLACEGCRSPNTPVAVEAVQRPIFSWLADQNMGTIVIDHVSRDAEGRGRWAIGSERKLSGLTGVSYSLLGHDRFAPGKRGWSTLRLGKDRVGGVARRVDNTKSLPPVATFVLDSHKDGSAEAMVLPVGTVKKSDAVACTTSSLLEAVSQFPELRWSELRTKVSGSNTAKAKVRDELLASGKIVEVDGHFRPVVPE